MRPISASLISAAVGTALLALLAGCSAGGSGSSGDLETDLGTLLAPYQVLDLGSRTIAPRDTAPDYSDASYRDRYVVFKRIDGGEAALGSRGSVTQADEVPTSASIPTCYVAVFELTRAQWQRIAGTTPWTAFDATGLAAAGTGADLPAVGISRTAAIAAFSGNHLGLPTPQQWEKAARGGAATTFAWGDTADEGIAGAYARVAETRGSSTGPVAPGGLQPNGYGLYDLAGNVWELVSGGTTAEIRGGSWNDTMFLSRCANRSTIDPDTAHALVGVRPVLVP